MAPSIYNSEIHLEGFRLEANRALQTHVSDQRFMKWLGEQLHNSRQHVAEGKDLVTAATKQVAELDRMNLDLIECLRSLEAQLSELRAPAAA